MEQPEQVARLVNEYAAVTVYLDHRTASPRLLVRNDRTGDQAVLDAVALEAIASLDAAAVSRLVTAFSETGRAGDTEDLA